MSVSMFAGTFLGTILSFATQNRRLAICRFLFGKHRLLSMSIGLVFLISLVLIPFLALSGFITINSTAFFLGGCLVYSFIISFTLINCTIAKPDSEA